MTRRVGGPGSPQGKNQQDNPGRKPVRQATVDQLGKLGKVSIRTAQESVKRVAEGTGDQPLVNQTPVGRGWCAIKELNPPSEENPCAKKENTANSQTAQHLSNQHSNTVALTSNKFPPTCGKPTANPSKDGCLYIHRL